MSQGTTTQQSTTIKGGFIMAEKPKAEEASRYTKRELMAVSKKLFGVPSELLAGALYGVTESITVDEAKARLKEFREKEVK